MDSTQYIEERLDAQIDWYDSRSRRNHRWYNVLRIVEIVAAAMIPFLAASVPPTLHIQVILVGTLGILIAIIGGVLSLYRFQELWIQYRTTCESLRHERYLFLTMTGPYGVKNPFSLLVQRAETLISEENSSWTQFIKPSDKEQNEG